MGRRNFLLFDRLVVRDTARRYPLEMVPLDRGRAWGFTVYNDHNQEVTVTLIGGESAVAAACGDLGAGATILANTREPVATDIWVAFLGIRLNYVVAPTVGDVTVHGWVQELDP